MEKRVYIRPSATVSPQKKRLLMALGVLFIGGVVAMQVQLTLRENAVASAKEDVSSTAAVVSEGVEAAAPAQSAIQEFKATLEQNP